MWSINSSSYWYQTYFWGSESNIQFFHDYLKLFLYLICNKVVNKNWFMQFPCNSRCGLWYCDSFHVKNLHLQQFLVFVNCYSGSLCVGIDNTSKFNTVYFYAFLSYHGQFAIAQVVNPNVFPFVNDLLLFWIYMPVQIACKYEKS